METTIVNPHPTKVIGRASECMRRLMEAGLSFDALQAPIDDPQMRARLVSFWQSGGYYPTTDQKMARRIMGRNFFGIEEAIQRFSVEPTKTQLATLAEIPFTEKILRECKDTHILVAILPLSIMDIKDRVDRNLLHSKDDPWYSDQKFAKDKGKACWHLVRKIFIRESINDIWEDLIGNDEMPSARVLVYTIIGYYLATGERLFKKIYFRSSDVTLGGDRVDVGVFDDGGLHVCFVQDGFRRRS